MKKVIRASKINPSAIIGGINSCVSDIEGISYISDGYDTDVEFAIRQARSLKKAADRLSRACDQLINLR